MSLFTHTLDRNIAHSKSGLSLLGWLTASLAVRRSRSQLARLDARLLDDVGIAKNVAQKEANRPVWDVPSHWIE